MPEFDATLLGLMGIGSSSDAGAEESDGAA
jgi:hypothetical protein